GRGRVPRRGARGAGGAADAAGGGADAVAGFARGGCGGAGDRGSGGEFGPRLRVEEANRLRSQSRSHEDTKRTRKGKLLLLFSGWLSLRLCGWVGLALLERRAPHQGPLAGSRLIRSRLPWVQGRGAIPSRLRRALAFPSTLHSVASGREHDAEGAGRGGWGGGAL